MDKLIYTALTGAKQVMDQQATVANNLANVSTAGFRAQIDSYQAVPYCRAVVRAIKYY